MSSAALGVSSILVGTTYRLNRQDILNKWQKDTPVKMPDNRQVLDNLDLMGIEDDQLLAIQNDLHERLKARDEARERAVSNKLHELEQKHEFANAQFLKHFAQVFELLEPTAKDAQAKVKPANKMLMLPALFDGEKPEKAKTH